MLNDSGQVIGVVSSRVEESQGRQVSGIGLAIPINRAIEGLQAQFVPALGQTVLELTTNPSRPRSTSKRPRKPLTQRTPGCRPRQPWSSRSNGNGRKQRHTPGAWKQLALLTCRHQPRSPTPTPHPSTYCRDWEDMVLAWIHQGNNYHRNSIFAYQAAYSNGRIRHSQSLPPEHEQLTLADADKLCVTGFPKGRIYNSNLGRHEEIFGTGRGELLPGTYKYWSSNDDDRVEAGGPVLYGGNFVNNIGERLGPDVSCGLVINKDEANESWVDMITDNLSSSRSSLTTAG